MSLIRNKDAGQSENGKGINSAFGELLIAENEPLIQISAEYGLQPGILTGGTIGGTVSGDNGMFSISTGTGPNNVSTIVSAREANQRPGQGMSCNISALFTVGVPDSTQFAGFLTSESGFGFGYDGGNFGVFMASGGALEIEELEVTTPAAGSEVATVVIDNVGYPVNLTSSTAEKNAYDIATQLNGVVPAFRFTSNQNKVIASSALPDVGGGLFAFTSNTAVAVWTQIEDSKLPIEQWFTQSSWNVDTLQGLDPTKLNDYKIQIQGNVNFYVKKKETGAFKLVHILKYINSNTAPSVLNPTFRVGWAARNKGNATNLTIKGIYGSAFLEGKLSYNEPTVGASNTQLAVGTTRTNIISFRNRLSYRGTSNRAEIIPKLLTFQADIVKPVLFEVILNPTVGASDLLEWEYLDEANSLMEIAKNPVSVTGGLVVATFGPGAVNIQDIVKFQSPGVNYSISATVSSGNADVSVSGTWIEDL